jgi:hypothetical protein
MSSLSTSKRTPSFTLHAHRVSNTRCRAGDPQPVHQCLTSGATCRIDTSPLRVRASQPLPNAGTASTAASACHSWTSGIVGADGGWLPLSATSNRMRIDSFPRRAAKSPPAERHQRLGGIIVVLYRYDGRPARGRACASVHETRPFCRGIDFDLD